MAVTDTPSTAPVHSAHAGERQAPGTVTAPGPTRGAPHPTPPAVPQAAPAAAPAAPLPLSIGFALSYDAATQRLVLEAREPGSGFLISQVPPGYVVKQFTASIGGIAPLRGAALDSAV